MAEAAEAAGRQVEAASSHPAVRAAGAAAVVRASGVWAPSAPSTFVSLHDWRVVAMTIDRCLLIVFAILLTTTLIACFSMSPGYVS